MVVMKKCVFLSISIITCCAYAEKPPASSVSIVTPQEEVYQKATDNAKQRISNYWNSTQMLVADIAQTNPDGTQIKGKLYLKKGNGDKAKLRVDYQSEYKQQLLIKKSEVLLIDLTDGAVAAYPVSMTPAGLILKPQLNFEKDVKLVDSRQIGNDVQLVLAQNDDENGGTLTLNFSIEGDCRLLRWKVLDPQGNITEVTLTPETIRINDEKLVPDSLF